MNGVDHDIVDARLRELARRVQRVTARRPASLKALEADEDLQDILARNLTLAIQAAQDIAYHLCAARGQVPPTSAEAFALLAKERLIPHALAERMARATGFRNVLVHEYTRIDWQQVLAATRDGTRDLMAFGKAVAALLDRA